MERLKFRAWDKIYRCMDYDLFLGLDGTLYAYAEKTYDTPNMEIEKVNDDDFVLMQFTGLHDNNDKMIYEGDIVKYTSTIKQWERELSDEIVGEVTIEIGMTYLVGKYLDGELKISNYKALLLNPDLFEVIGDTHNNPELLESEE